MPDGLYYFEATSEACERCQLHEGFHPTDALAHDLCRCTSTAVKLDDTKKKKGKDCVEVFFNMNVDDGTTIERFENHHDDAGCHGGFGDHDIEREYTYTVDPDAELTDDGRFVLDFEGLRWSELAETNYLELVEIGRDSRMGRVLITVVDESIKKR